MSEGQRVSRAKSKPDRPGAGSAAERPGAASARAPAPSAEWAAAQLGSAFPLGVQRKVQIGPSGDAYEQQADRVAADVASGRSIAPSAISPIGSLASPVNQRAEAAPAPEKKPEKKKEEKPAAPVQKADAPAGKKPDEKKKDDKKAAPTVQKADKPGEKDKKKEEKPKTPAPVQKADKPAEKKPEEKKKDDKKAPAPAVQKAEAPADKKPDEKDKKKEEKPKTPAPVQKADKAAEKKPDEKKKEEKPKTPAPVQKADKAAEKKPDEKKKDDKKAAAVQKADAPADKKPDDKKKEPEKKKETPAAGAPVQKAGPSAPAASMIPKEKDKKEESGKSLEEKLATAAVQRASGSAPTPSMENAAARAIQSKGAGEPIHAPMRSALESRMGVDLGGVRMHQDRGAHDTADAINARAFTHGNDIWLGRGQSQSDTGLMAHEATHVVQQAGGVHRMLVQRETPKKKDSKAPSGSVDLNATPPTVEIDVLHIPTIKDKFIETKTDVVLTKEERGDQRKTWVDNVKPAVQAALPNALKDVPGVVPESTEGVKEAGKNDPNRTVFLELPGATGGSYLLGTPQQLSEEFVIPRWGPQGQPRPLDVDHQKELQLGGKDVIDNMWLLDASANRSSGSQIANQIRTSVAAAVAPEVGKGKKWEAAPTVNDLIDQGFQIKAKQVKADLSVAGEPSAAWDKGQVEKVTETLKPLKALSTQEIVSRKLAGDRTRLVLYPLPAGGRPRVAEKFDPNQESQPFPKVNPPFPAGFEPKTLNYKKGGGGGSIAGVVFPGKRRKKISPDPKDVTVDVKDVGGIPYTAAVDPSNLVPSMKFLSLQGLSPLEFHYVGFEDPAGLVARGKVRPTLPFVKEGFDIDITVTGEDVTLSKTFTKDDFALPGPIKITSASLTLSLDVGNLEPSFAGDVFFEIERVGKGQLSAGFKDGLFVKGQFDFDTELFDPARVKVSYEGDKFTGSGDIGIKDGKVKGIKSASLNVTIDGDKISASGSVKPNIPGVEQGDLAFSYDPATGVVIGGKLTLKKDIPGLEGGSISAELSKKPGDEKWRVKAAGEATPKIPGVSSKLSVTYDDGAFDAVVTAGYEKGMLKGAITVGATNRPVGDDGKPSGPPPDKGDKVTIYGGGSVTLKIAPWLQATAAIKLLPNGEIEVTGEIGLPAALEIFKEKKLDKNIFKVGIDIPIVGVSVAGQRIGIFANISGGLDLSAGIGPGELNQLKLAVTYNPAHEENTKVTGDANLHIPAHAGLRLFVRGSLGVGIPIVSASAGIEIGGALGLEGALDAGVHVEWTPTKGLDLTAQASVYVEPKLKFDVTGFVLVEADLLLTTIELYSKKWQLASFEYGSGLRFGLKFPIHYQEGRAFDISLSDVEFEVPKVDPGELLSGLVKKIA